MWSMVSLNSQPLHLLLLPFPPVINLPQENDQTKNGPQGEDIKSRLQVTDVQNNRRLLQMRPIDVLSLQLQQKQGVIQPLVR